MNNNPYESSNSPQYVMRDEDPYRNAGISYNDPYRNAGMPYATRNDQPLWIPKRFGIGYTINFNHPQAKWLVIGFLVFILVVILIPVLLVLLLR